MHNLFDNGGDKRINGIVLVHLKNDGYLKPKYYIKSKRKECHYRPIMLYEVIHADNGN